MIAIDMVRIVAEIGCNHMGSFDLAKSMIRLLAGTQADYAKFQKRDVYSMDSARFHAPHPHPQNSFGATYGLHREFLEFDLDQHRDLKSECESAGIGYACSVWDLKSAAGITSLNPDYIKIPSAHNRDFALLESVFERSTAPVHISLGSMPFTQTEELVAWLAARHALPRTVLYACTALYPARANELGLLEISRLVETFGARIQGVGFSGHHTSTGPDNAAVALGAKWIERHFTFDRSMKGTDHQASLNPEQFKQLAQSLRETEASLTFKSEDIFKAESAHRQKWAAPVCEPQV